MDILMQFVTSGIEHTPEVLFFQTTARSSFLRLSHSFAPRLTLHHPIP